MRSKPKFSVIILAGGYSSRMGEFKPLLKIGEKTAVEQAINNFYSIGITDIRVVVGHKGEDIIETLSKSNLKIRVVLNKNYEKGMYSSIVEGVKSLEDDITAFFLLPVDNPMIKQKTIQNLMDYFKKNDDKDIVYPSFNGMRGHPPLISTKFNREILFSNPPHGLRSILNRHEKRAMDVSVVDHGILLDMDTPEDYRRLQEYIEYFPYLDEEECMAIYSQLNSSDKIIQHGKMVAILAECIAIALNKKGYALKIPLLKSAAFLHDIGKGKHHHAKIGAQIMKEYGYEEIADIIACHMDIRVEQITEISEKEVVYLADKLIKEDQFVGIEARFKGSIERFAQEPKILQSVLERLKSAHSIQIKIEEVIGMPIKTFLKDIG
jgi:molybdenum cofactor cytidylyltransferase